MTTPPPPPKTIPPAVLQASQANVTQGLNTYDPNFDYQQLRALSKEPTPPPPIANIAKAISAVMSEIGVVAKEGTNKFHNYKYATIGDVLHKLTPLLGKHGLMIVQNEVEHKIDQRHIAVTYEFTIAHESGEVWPDKPRKTGMSLAVDKGGGWDDKAFNKSATAARKYFLLELFQVPTGDMTDVPDDPGSEEHDGDERVPLQQQRASAPPPPPPPVDETKPHRIVLGKGSGAAAWVQAFIKAIGKATDENELQGWIETNSPIMANLAKSNPDLYQRVQAATTTKHESFEAMLEPVSDEDFIQPLAAKDFDAAINMIGNRLVAFQNQKEMEAWWNMNVAPTEKQWFAPDFDLLLKEFSHNEVRIAAQEAK